ncbi:MAG TPA: PASTA domain-containing protein [Candidatus Polarisedimenticolia bacterium]|nr:PASTA domain-containing protein [Candidatus Polarisedimenticolia bacterium]
MKLPGRDRLRGPLKLLLKLAALACALVIVAALSTYYTVRRSISGRDVQVPDLTRMTLAEATQALQERGLLLEEAAERNDPGIEAGRVLAQDPPAGTDIKLQRKVKVVVSLGDKVTPIPDLQGGAARKAQITLQQQGLRLGEEVYAYSDSVGENLVIGQDPLPGLSGVREGKVSLLVSRGSRPQAYVMPNFIGRRESEARNLLARAGLKTGPARRDPSLPGVPGTIVAQDPEAGFPVRAGDLVILTVAQ